MWKDIKKIFNSPDALISLVLGLTTVLIIGTIIVRSWNQTKKEEISSSSTTREEEQVKLLNLPSSYTVKEGDTLWSIAENYYKSGYNWSDIATANTFITDPEYITPGLTLTMPAVPTKEVGQISSMSTVKAKNASVTVQTGDSLWNIAIAQYGDGTRWPEIAQKNSIGNPDLIYPGAVLQMP